MAKKKKQQEPTAGQIYAVPIAGGEVGLAQIVHAMPVGRSHTITAAIFPGHVADTEAAKQLAEELDLSEPLTVTTLSDNPVDEGDWTLIATREVTCISQAELEARLTPHYGWLDGKQNPWQGILEMYHGIWPWDAFHDPRYLDKILLPGRSRPPEAKDRSQFTREELEKLGLS